MIITPRDKNDSTGITYRVYQWSTNHIDDPYQNVGHEWQFDCYEAAMGWFHMMVKGCDHKVEVIPMINREECCYSEGHVNQFVILSFWIGPVYTEEIYQIYVEEIPCR